MFGYFRRNKDKDNKSTEGTDNDEENSRSPKRELQEYLINCQDLKSVLKFSISQHKDAYRALKAYESGGIMCEDFKQVEKLRSVGKQMIKLIGRKILSGSFNLTTISFPIKACYPKTALYNSVSNVSCFPYFMNQAAITTDTLHRFKLAITVIMSSAFYLNVFLKPLNPILGQTLQASLIDGTLIYAEQISHHPPISYFLIYGPNEIYRYSGYYDFDISPGINSLKLKNIGKRLFQFKNSETISITYPMNEFSGTFIGKTRVEEVGECTFVDAVNDLKCLIQFGKLKKKPTDCFQTYIFQKDKKICEVEGTYCGFIEFDKIRYWDARDITPLHLNTQPQVKLKSDWSLRIDVQHLVSKNCDMDQAQSAKQDLEEAQRKDARLRKKNKEN